MGSAFRGCLVVGGVLTLLSAGPAEPQTYDEPQDRRAADVLPPELATGPLHRVQDPVTADGYMHHYAVVSSFGTWDVTGHGALRKLVRELAAIRALREIKGTDAFTRAVADSASSPLRFARALIAQPADTVSGMPRGAWKFLEEVGSAVTSERDPTDDPAYKKALLMSGRKREYAAQLGIDPYSTNAVLQKELNSVAWAAAVGNLTVSAALMPVGGGASAALTTTRTGQALADQLRNEPASRLRITNQTKLKAMGVPPDLVKSFLDHPAFTPRHDTLLVESLARLGAARGRDRLLRLALGAADEADANFFTNTAQLLRGYHETVSPLTEIQAVAGRVMVAQARSGVAVVALPLDHLAWTPGAERRADEVKAAYRGAGFSGKFDVWLSGTASPLARQRLAERGMTVVEEIGARVEIVD